MHECAARNFANGIYLLHASGASVREPLAESGSTPLHLCAMNDSLEAAEALYCCGAFDKHGAKAKNVQGVTAIDIAKQFQSKRVLQLLQKPPKLAADVSSNAALFKRPEPDIASLPPLVQRPPQRQSSGPPSASSSASEARKQSHKSPRDAKSKRSKTGDSASKAKSASSAPANENVCHGCQKAIQPGAPFLRALGKVFHLEHLVCAECGKQFDNGMFLTTGKVMLLVSQACSSTHFLSLCLSLRFRRYRPFSVLEIATKASKALASDQIKRRVRRVWRRAKVGATSRVAEASARRDTLAATSRKTRNRRPSRRLVRVRRAHKRRYRPKMPQQSKHRQQLPRL